MRLFCAPTRWCLGATLVALLTVTAGADAQEYTFTRDVAPVLYEKCVGCHRPGGMAPMSLLTYADVRPRARAIREAVASRSMPPWFADPAIGRFTNDPTLNDEQMRRIAGWIDGGMLEGDARDLPAAPRFPSEWRLGPPDLVLALPKFDVPAAGGDHFPRFTIPLSIPSDRWIRAVDIVPTNPAIAHHAAVFSDDGSQFAGWAVGTPPIVYAPGTGRRLRAQQTLHAEVHYHSSRGAASDQLRIGLYFGSGPLTREVAVGLAGNQTFAIPAGAPNHEVRSTYVVDQDIQVLYFAAHMHLRGRDMTISARFPDGGQATLLRVPAYNFNWQLPYYPAEGARLPRGTLLDVVAHYDNSSANRRNPDPRKTVTFGTTTVDEMMVSIFEFVAVNSPSPRRSTVASRMEAVRDTRPADWTYTVDIVVDGERRPTVLRLPRNGDGAWYLELSPRGAVAPELSEAQVSDIRWQGSQFEARVQLESGPPFAMRGRIVNGLLQGQIDWPPSPSGRARAFVSTASPRLP